MKPTSTTAAKFHFDVTKSAVPALVDFYADWCSMCRHLHPVLDELADAWAGRLKIVKVDVEKNPSLAHRFDIRNLPTLVLFDGGVEKLRIIAKARRVDIEPHLVEVLGAGASTGGASSTASGGGYPTTTARSSPAGPVPASG